MAVEGLPGRNVSYLINWLYKITADKRLYTKS